jgi:hypothetical protein
MELTEHDHCYLYEGVFPEGIIAGFTKPRLEGRLPHKDAQKALSFLDTAFAVSYMEQVHGSKVHLVSSGGMYVGDGLLTKEKGLVLAVKTADCMPVILHSRTEGILAAVHMGWRSAKEGILANVGEDLSTFTAVIGPALRKCCYEVGEEFLDFGNMSPFIEKKGKKLYFDPVAFARAALIERGLKEENFFDTRICSYCSFMELYSHRRTAQKNRTISFIVKV